MGHASINAQKKLFLCWRVKCLYNSKTVQTKEVVMPELDRITIQHDVCMGQPCIRGMRITVSVLLKMLAAGKSDAEIIAAYTEIETEDIRQAMQYAAWIVSDQIRYIKAA